MHLLVGVTSYLTSLKDKDLESWIRPLIKLNLRVELKIRQLSYFTFRSNFRHPILF